MFAHAFMCPTAVWRKEVLFTIKAKYPRFVSVENGELFCDHAFHRLLNCLEQIRQKLGSREDDFLFLSNYFQSKEFRKLFKVHSTVSCSDDGGTQSEVMKGGTAVGLAKEVAEALRPNSHVNKEIQELEHILTKPHVKGLLHAHDLIAAGDFTSTPPEELGSDMLFNLNEKPGTAGTEHQIILVGNFEKDETKDVNNREDYGGNDRSDNDDDDRYDNDDDGDVRSGDQTEVTDKVDHYETNDTSNCENTMDSDSSSSSIPDNKHVMVPKARAHVTDTRVHVTDTCMRNSSADHQWWDVSASDTNTEESSTFQAPVLNRNDVSEISQGATKNVENITTVFTIDIKEKKVIKVKDGHMVNRINDTEKDIDVKEGKKEKDIKDRYKRNDVEDGQKSGVPAAAVANNVAKTVRLFRNAKETLGITVKVVKNADNTERIVVARILSGGLAHTFGALHIDDEILEINGRRVEGMTANEVADMMDGMTGSVDVKIVPVRKDRKLTRETKVSLRAFFDYNPLQDPLIPCKEVGVAFCTGEVLHVVNMDDAKWWQARKEGCSHDKAGLIPSKAFQEKRQQLNKISSSADVSLQKDENGRPTLPFWRKRKNDSNKVLCNFLQEMKMSDCPAYEPVARYLETPEKRRLLLLIGASGVGRNELKKMLLSTNPDKFVTTVPHTSRHMKSYETDGREYFFVSRQTMENFIQKRKFIEFGEYKGCLYGTSKDSIKKALKTGKTCVLKVQPEVMLLLRTAEFKPYCIYIKPPTLKELRTSRLTVQPGKAKRPSNTSNMRTFKEEDLQEMISASRELEETYGKFFDLTVVNKDTEEAYNSIVEAVERLEQEEQWVPQDWVQKT